MRLPFRLLIFIAVAVFGFIGGGASMAGPSGGKNDFLESSRRQDFTGKGTYHRQGLLREQDAAIKGSSAGKPTPPPSQAKPKGWQWFCSLFR